MQLGKRSKIAIVPGVTPKEDSTALDTLYFTDSNRIRFQSGKLRQINGWNRVFFDNFQTLDGAARNIFSYHDSDANPITVIGTNTRFYAVVQSNLYNITPLSTDTVNIPNAFTTEYNAGVNVVVNTISGSSVVTLNITNYLNTNDTIQISGVTGGPYNGIPAASFINTFGANVLSGTQIQINTGSLATSTGSVTVNMTWATSYLYVTYAANGLPKGDRVGILLSSAVDGIPDTSINIENYITNVVNANIFTIQTDTIATSKVTAGGGASTTIQIQIDAGNYNQSAGFGYGGGNYGTGNYGIPKAFTNFTQLNATPRIWSTDTFGGFLILTPGDPVTSSTDNLYVWMNDVTVAPTLVSAQAGAANVPLAVRWLYVSNSILVVLASGDVLNSYISSAAGIYYDFTISSATLAYSTTIEQAGQLISQASCRNRDVVFTQNDAYVIDFVEAPFIWLIRKLFTTDGIIGPKARAEIEDAVFWMGKGDFYVFDGTSVNVLPNNTVKRYVYDNIDFSQSFKFFAYPNVAYQEISWFVVFKGQSEPINYVTYNYKEQHWVIGMMPRTAAEEPINIEETPLMVQTILDGEDILFQQESGLNDYNYDYNPVTDPIENQYAPLNAFAATNFAQIDEGNNTMLIYSVFPDSFQSENVTLTVNGKLYAQAPFITSMGSPYTISQATTKVDVMLVARQRQYIIQGSGVNSDFLIGHWIEEAKESSTR